ncbi:hypothetical protein I5770_02195 [Brucella sp. BO2]|uniref:hypothetical protein n=1 Tax=Brucella sp. BO2 TaxID=693750 RepID=UPI0009FCE40B|nr:hypothetical protein [Brucella sp. BO2]QPN27478.1 hypothetical protein I5770_02195 [Brucella sp. BO2]
MSRPETYEKDNGLRRNYITAKTARQLGHFHAISRPFSPLTASGTHSVRLRASEGSIMGMPPRTG